MTLHMKSKNLILTAILMAVSSTVMAQENIQKAFDALKQSKGQEETYTNHFLERDPDTGLMEGMSDEYEFKIADKANKHLITAISKAFTKDEQAAYSVSTGSHGGAENYISLAVGNGNKGVGIGEMKDSRWIYACFLDPEDTLRAHRYAYAMEWVEKVATNRRHGLANSIICGHSSRRNRRVLLPILGLHRSISSVKTKMLSRLMMLRGIWLKQRSKN